MGVKQPVNGMVEFRCFVGRWNQISRRGFVQSDLHFNRYGSDMDIKHHGNGYPVMAFCCFIGGWKQTGDSCLSGHDLPFDKFGDNLDNCGERAQHKLGSHRFISGWNQIGGDSAKRLGLYLT